MLPGICSVGLGRGLVHGALTPSRCVGFGWWGPGDIPGGASPGAPARLAEESLRVWGPSAWAISLAWAGPRPDRSGLESRTSSRASGGPDWASGRCGPGAGPSSLHLQAFAVLLWSAALSESVWSCFLLTVCRRLCRPPGSDHCPPDCPSASVVACAEHTLCGAGCDNGHCSKRWARVGPWRLTANGLATQQGASCEAACARCGPGVSPSVPGCPAGAGRLVSGVPSEPFAAHTPAAAAQPPGSESLRVAEVCRVGSGARGVGGEMAYLTACRRWKAGPGSASKPKLLSPSAATESGKDSGRVGRIRPGPTAPSMSGVSLAEATLCSESPAPRVLISAHLHPCGGCNVGMGAGWPLGPALLNSGIPSAPADCAATGHCDLRVSSEGRPSLPPGIFASLSSSAEFFWAANCRAEPHDRRRPLLESPPASGRPTWGAHHPEVGRPLLWASACPAPSLPGVAPAPTAPRRPPPHRPPRCCHLPPLLPPCQPQRPEALSSEVVGLQLPPALPWPQERAFCEWSLGAVPQQDWRTLQWPRPRLLPAGSELRVGGPWSPSWPACAAPLRLRGWQRASSDL